jgi:hypothetical protein
MRSPSPSHAQSDAVDALFSEAFALLADAPPRTSKKHGQGSTARRKVSFFF